MFCHKCGNKIAVDAEFCHKCGTKIVIDETPVQQTYVEPKPPTAASESAYHNYQQPTPYEAYIAPVEQGIPLTEEKVKWNVTLTGVSIGANKMEVIKTVLELTGRGLYESKAMVENVPQILFVGISENEADYVKERLEDVGATIITEKCVTKIVCDDDAKYSSDTYTDDYKKAENNDMPYQAVKNQNEQFYSTASDNTDYNFSDKTIEECHDYVKRSCDFTHSSPFAWIALAFGIGIAFGASLGALMGTGVEWLLREAIYKIWGTVVTDIGFWSVLVCSIVGASTGYKVIADFVTYTMENRLKKSRIQYIGTEISNIHRLIDLFNKVLPMYFVKLAHIEENISAATNGELDSTVIHKISFEFIDNSYMIIFSSDLSSYEITDVDVKMADDNMAASMGAGHMYSLDSGYKIAAPVIKSVIDFYLINFENKTVPETPHNENKLDITLMRFSQNWFVKFGSVVVSCIIVVLGVRYAINTMKEADSEMPSGGLDFLDEVFDSSSEDKYVQMVKDGRLSGYPNKTVGKAFNDFMGNARWSSGVSEEGQRFVNVKGKIMYADKEVEAVVQFFIDSNEEFFEYNACEFNGIPQSYFVFLALLEKIYGDDSGGGSGYYYSSDSQDQNTSSTPSVMAVSEMDRLLTNEINSAISGGYGYMGSDGYFYSDTAFEMGVLQEDFAFVVTCNANIPDDLYPAMAEDYGYSVLNWMPLNDIWDKYSGIDRYISESNEYYFDFMYCIVFKDYAYDWVELYFYYIPSTQTWASSYYPLSRYGIPHYNHTESEMSDVLYVDFINSRYSISD